MTQKAKTTIFSISTLTDRIIKQLNDFGKKES